MREQATRRFDHFHIGERCLNRVRDANPEADTFRPLLPEKLEVICGRLAGGAAARTEADVQSDVREFLFNAPLQLADPDLVDVKLEAQAGEGRRIDVEAGCAAIEVKRSIDSKTCVA